MSSTTIDHPFYFSPGSAFWEMNRERALLFGGGRVLLMQLAHPMVAEAVFNHSYVFQKPLLRLHRTLSLTFAVVYGTKHEVDRAIAEIEQAHRPAVGQLAEAVGKHKAGALYNARNPRQGLWVWATLVEGAVAMYERLVTPVSPAVKQEFYAESTTFARLMGISENMLPIDYNGLLDYMENAIDSEEVHVGPKARQIAPFITAQSIPLLNLLTYPSFRMTVGLLPPELRGQYHYDFGDWEQTMLNGICAASRTLVPLMPGMLRYVSAYRRAMAQIQ